MRDGSVTKMSEYLAASVLVLISKPLLVRRPCRGHHLAPSLRASPHPKRQILGSPSCLFVCFLSFQVTPPPHPFGLLQSNLVGYGPPPPASIPTPVGCTFARGDLSRAKQLAPSQEGTSSSPGLAGAGGSQSRGAPRLSPAVGWERGWLWGGTGPFPYL